MLELVTLMVGLLFSIVCAIVGFCAGKMSASLEGKKVAENALKHTIWPLNGPPVTYDDFKNPRIFGVKMPEID